MDGKSKPRWSAAPHLVFGNKADDQDDLENLEEKLWSIDEYVPLTLPSAADVQCRLCQHDRYPRYRSISRQFPQTRRISLMSSSRSSSFPYSRNHPTRPWSTLLPWLLCSSIDPYASSRTVNPRLPVGLPFHYYTSRYTHWERG